MMGGGGGIYNVIVGGTWGHSAPFFTVKQTISTPQVLNTFPATFSKQTTLARYQEHKRSAKRIQVNRTNNRSYLHPD